MSWMFRPVKCSAAIAPPAFTSLSDSRALSDVDDLRERLPDFAHAFARLLFVCLDVDVLRRTKFARRGSSTRVPFLW